MERFNKFLALIAFRLFLLLIFTAVLSITYPVTSRHPHEKQAILEISGLKSGEIIKISKWEWLSEREIAVDEKGVATFVDISLGNWRVVEGGSEELRKLIIPIREYPPELKEGSIHVTYKEKISPPALKLDRPYI